MKSRKILLGLVGMLVFMYSCTTVKTTTVHTNPNGKVPPGQMKKQTGSQSAKPYAPGQQKKQTASQSAKPTPPGQQKKAEAAPSNNSKSPGQAKKK